MAQVLNRATMLARAALGKGSILGTCKLFCEMFVSLEFLNQNIFAENNPNFFRDTI